MNMRRATPLLTTDAARFVQIEHALRSGQATAAALTVKCDCSLATLKRSLKAMREELGAPIFYDHYRRRYRLVDAWPGVYAAIFEGLETATRRKADPPQASSATARTASPEYTEAT